VEPELRTALIVPVGGLPEVIDRWRERTCVFKPSAGVPPHITLVFPFVSAGQVTDSFISGLSDLFRECVCFAFDLGELRRFPATLYLAPEPSEPFAALSEVLADHYPECEPHVHAFGEVVPHRRERGDHGRSRERNHAAATDARLMRIGRPACGDAGTPHLLVSASATTSESG
jgi:hypothetical protein